MAYHKPHPPLVQAALLLKKITARRNLIDGLRYELRVKFVGKSFTLPDVPAIPTRPTVAELTTVLNSLDDLVLHIERLLK